MMKTHNSPKARLEVRLTADLKKAAAEAAALANCDVTALVARGLAREIEEVRSQFSTLWLSNERFDHFMSIAEQVRPISPKLQDAALRLDQEGFNFEQFQETEQDQAQP